ncbi:MAG: helix-turn-helix domain-containing protein [Sphingomonadales bacterium]
MSSFATLEVSASDRRERGSMIGSILSDCFAAKWAVDPLGGEEVPARISIARADGVTLSRAQMTPMRLRNPQPTGDRKYYVYTADQRAHVRIGGRGDLLINPHELLVMRSDLPSDWAINSYYETSSLVFDADLFEEHVPAHADVIGKKLCFSPSMQFLLGSMIESAWELTSSGLFEQSGLRLGRAFLDMYSTALTSRLCAASDLRAVPTALDARRLQIKAYVRKHFADSGLSASTIAHALRISPRYVQLAFAAEENTPSEFIRRVRLEASASLLSQPEDRRSITEISYDCGFNSSSHFSTQFKSHFGMSPRDYRETSLRARAVN